MFKSKLTGLLGVFFFLCLLGCDRDDEPRLRAFSAEFSTLFPEDFEVGQAAGVTVRLKNLASGSQQEKVTDAEGKVVFEELIPGSYELSASMTLSEEQAMALTGIPAGINLNYLDNSLALSEELASKGPISVQLSGSVTGGLVIKQVYYSGSKTPEGGNYFFDQFFEIYNNSSEPIALDGLMLSNVYGVSGQINPDQAPSPFQDDKDHVYISTAWRIPGAGQDNILQPFTGVIIAQQGINHQAEEANPGSPVDLSNADFELFVVGSTRDVDAPNVPNMEMVYHPFNATFSLVPVFGPGTIIWRTDDFSSLEQVAIPDTSPTFPQVVKVPNSLVLDAVETLRSEADGAYKRIAASLDAGFAYVSNTYTGESVIRKSASVDGNTVYQDTNNSQLDFELSATPVLP
ncbi:hypothetical protein J2X69_001289 [Algoriphagus sp. 4150]|uniref:DUF4876 domain-containing protein n=1 Tax=Algoriphagus sp. 4150 TaxID=2817756 RepID=UPI0028640CC9|nr:DUF4876 domain-containing protein [Algoriphagus sp. 4150]MDR7128954.1 hypothetical protein [Algoriphagus sp. 4150]